MEDHMPGVVYILKNDHGSFYIGSTDNLRRRLEEHRQGKTQTSRDRRMNLLVFSQEFTTLSEARRIERRLKDLKRKDYIEKIIQDGYIKLAKKPS